MTLHAIMTTALTHPLQVLSIGMIVSRGVRAAVSMVREKRRVRLPDCGSRPVRALAPLGGPLGAASERDGLRFTEFRRSAAAESTAARMAM